MSDASPDGFDLDKELLRLHREGADPWAIIAEARTLAPESRLTYYESFLLALSDRKQAEQDALIREAVEAFGIKRRRSGRS